MTSTSAARCAKQLKKNAAPPAPHRWCETGRTCGPSWNLEDKEMWGKLVVSTQKNMFDRIAIPFSMVKIHSWNHNHNQSDYAISSNLFLFYRNAVSLGTRVLPLFVVFNGWVWVCVRENLPETIGFTTIFRVSWTCSIIYLSSNFKMVPYVSLIFPALSLSLSVSLPCNC